MPSKFLNVHYIYTLSILLAVFLEHSTKHIVRPSGPGAYAPDALQLIRLIMRP